MKATFVSLQGTQGIELKGSWFYFEELKSIQPEGLSEPRGQEERSRCPPILCRIGYRAGSISSTNLKEWGPGSR